MSATAEPYWNLDEITAGLSAARDDWRTAHGRQSEHGHRGFPSRLALETILADLSGVLFPLRLAPGTLDPASENDYVTDTLDRALAALREQVRLELGYHRECKDAAIAHESGRIVGAFAHGLPDLRRLLDTDVEAAYAGDPAARSVDEVLICYPGIQAVIPYRLAHALYDLGAPLVARILAEIAHSLTGIDIHPGATIGHGFFIDHGSGVVIGETAIVGNRVRIYQAVTLGAVSFPAAEDGSLIKGQPRHPIVEDDVVIYAGATILGRVTVGAGAVIGGNVWLTESVAPGSVIHQAYAARERTGTTAVPTGHVVDDPAVAI